MKQIQVNNCRNEKGGNDMRVLLVFLLTCTIVLLGTIIIGEISPMAASGSSVETVFKYLWYIWISFLGFLMISAFIVIAVVWIMFNKTFGKQRFSEEEMGLSGMLGGLNGMFGHMRGKVNGNMFFSHKRTIEIPETEIDFNIFNVKTINGDIEIHGIGEEKAHAIVDVYESEPGDVTAYFKDGSIKLESKSGKKAILYAAKIYLPGNMKNVKASSASGDIEIEGFNNADLINGKSISGDIKLADCSGISYLEVKSVSGDITIEKCVIKNIESASVSGDINMDNSKTDVLNAKTTSGDVNYKTSTVLEKNVYSVSGDIAG